MKPVIYATVVLLLAGTVACNRSSTADTPAQSGTQSVMGQGNPTRMHRFARIFATLGLSEAQKDQIRTIMANARSKSQGADPETRRANMKDAMAQVDTVLTPDQRTQFHAKLQAMREHQGASQPPSSQ